MSYGINYDKVPVDYMRDSVCRYIEHGIEPGHFLMALFSNDLMEAFKRADDNNSAAMVKWVGFRYWEMPSASHGSPEKVRAWMAHRGLERLEAETDAAEERNESVYR